MYIQAGWPLKSIGEYLQRPAVLPVWLVTCRDALSYFQNRIINIFTPDK